MDWDRDPGRAGLTRRQVLRGGVLAAGAATVLPLPRALAAVATRQAPPGFPASVPIARRTYENWCTAIDVNGLWTATPGSAQDVVEIVNWAHGAGWTVRARGSMHGWSPLTVTADTTSATPTVLVDTSGLTAATVVSQGTGAVRFGAGTKMLDLLNFLNSNGLGLTSVPATGGPTIGGVLTIGGHGAALPAAGEAVADHVFGSVSNLVLELTAVVWDDIAGRYVLNTFDRSEPDTGAFLVHLGRAFVTDVMLRATQGQNVRCQSSVDVPISELFAPPGSSGRTFESYVDQAGRVEAIWYPFTDKPWLKVWSVASTKPASSRAVTGAYNYPFSDQIPPPVAALARQIILGETQVAPELGAAQYAVTAAGLIATDSSDLWGPAKDTQLYIRASTLRYDELGYSILTSRANLQRVINLFTAKYSELLDSYRAQKQFPINGPLEIRCCAVDDPSLVGVPGAQVPALAATAPRLDQLAWDTLVWTNALTFTGTPNEYRFYRDLEQWILATFDGTWATPRQEWSKLWAFTETAAWSDPTILSQTIPQLHTVGRPADGDWSWALGRLDAYDPHRVYTNEFLTGFLP
jgi:FAD/FMN-containing dehydrogenase